MVESIFSWAQGTLLTDAEKIVQALAHLGTACVEIDVKHGIIRIIRILETKNIGYSYRAHVRRFRCSQLTILFCNTRVGSTVPAFEFRSGFGFRQRNSTPVSTNTHVVVKTVVLEMAQVQDDFG